MPRFPLAARCFLTCFLTAAFALCPVARAAPAEALSPVSAPALQGEDQLFKDILTVLDGATITQLQAKVSLESFKVGQGKVELRGLSLKDFNLGLKLKPAAAKRLFALAEKRLPEAQKPPGLFEILKFGVFQEIEIGIHFDELAVGFLKASATDLDVQGLLLQAGINGPQAQDLNNLSSRDALLVILRRAVQKQIEVHAGLQKLSAKQINAQVQNVALLGFRVGLSLRRNSD